MPEPAITSTELAAVGAGTGVPLGVAFLAAMTLLLRERRKNRALNDEKSWSAAEADRRKAEVDRQRQVWFASQNQGTFEVSGMASPVELHSNDIRI